MSEDDDEDEITESKKPRYDVRNEKTKEREKEKDQRGSPQKRSEKEIRSESHRDKTPTKRRSNEGEKKLPNKEATNCDEMGKKDRKLKRDNFKDLAMDTKPRDKAFSRIKMEEPDKKSSQKKTSPNESGVSNSQSKKQIQHEIKNMKVEARTEIQAYASNHKTHVNSSKGRNRQSWWAEKDSGSTDGSYRQQDLRRYVTPPTSHPSTGFSFREETGDLFKCPERFSLCHCVSADFHMSKGIAKIFKRKFKGLQELFSFGE